MVKPSVIKKDFTSLDGGVETGMVIDKIKDWKNAIPYRLINYGGTYISWCLDQPDFASIYYFIQVKR